MCRRFSIVLKTESSLKCASCDCAHANAQSLDGTGAKIYGGRWNSAGRSVVYSASCGALAALEYMVHMTKLPANMLLVRIEIPNTLAIEKVDSLPADEKAFRQLGDEWLEHRGTVALHVPSVLVPRQWNILLNPEHPLFPSNQNCRPNAVCIRFETALYSAASITGVSCKGKPELQMALPYARVGPLPLLLFACCIKLGHCYFFLRARNGTGRDRFYCPCRVWRPSANRRVQGNRTLLPILG